MYDKFSQSTHDYRIVLKRSALMYKKLLDTFMFHRVERLHMRALNNRPRNGLARLIR